MTMVENFSARSWDQLFSAHEQAHAIQSLETGSVLFFPVLNFALHENEKKFLSPFIVDPKNKNISWNPKTHELNGTVLKTQEKMELTQMLTRYATEARGLIERLFPQYVEAMQIGRTSFRPVEIEGRVTSPRQDDKRLHVDAFPSSPNQGKRLLRVFCNINTHGVARVWRLGEPFPKVAATFLPKVSKAFPGSRQILHWLGITKTYRTLYDHTMLQIHDRMKLDDHYQKTAEQIEFSFPPQTTWIVQTDQVSHAALSGQHLLEQTFYLPVEAMHDQRHAPLRVLEKMIGRVLV